MGNIREECQGMKKWQRIIYSINIYGAPLETVIFLIYCFPYALSSPGLHFWALSLEALASSARAMESMFFSSSPGNCGGELDLEGCLTGLMLDKCRAMLSMWPKASFSTDFSLIKGHRVSSLGSQPGWCSGPLL